MTTFVSHQIRRPALSFAGPAHRATRSFAAARGCVVRSFRAIDAASTAQRGQGVDAAGMLMLGRD